MKHQKGVLLLEALVAVVIFVIGVLGLVGLQASSTRHTTESINRVSASELAESYISQMRIARYLDQTGGWYTNYQTGGAAYNSWLSQVQNALPGANANPPTVVITQPATNMQGTWQIQIIMNWNGQDQTAGNAAATHQLTLYTQV